MGIAIGPPVDGRLPEPRFLSAEAVEAAGPRFFARASQADWWALIEGGLDPIAAIVQKRLVARGDLTPVIARLQYRELAERWLVRLRDVREAGSSGKANRTAGRGGYEGSNGG